MLDTHTPDHSPTLNLTAAEAAQRAALIQVSNYRIHIDLSDTSAETFPVRTEVEFAVQDPAQTQQAADLFIDAVTDSVSSIVLNDQELDPAQYSDGTRIYLPGCQAENKLTVQARFRFMNTGEGLHRFVDPADGQTYLYTQFEVPDARRVFCCFEQPDLKAVYHFTVDAAADWVVVSNSAHQEPVAVRDGINRWIFDPTPRISSYITAIIAGPYAHVHDELTSADGRTIPLGIYARQSLMPYVDEANIFALTKQGFEVFEKHYDWPYPFSKYDQLFVPDFNAGAMENAGAVTFLERYVFRGATEASIVERRAITILHELAHMWFGNLVTMKWWNDLWLNESFAEFMSHLAAVENTDFRDAWTTFGAVEKNWAYRQDQLSSTHPIVAPIRDLEDVQVNFDGITYAKGAAVLRQLVAWVGQDHFMEAVRNYVHKHAWSNTVLDDLLSQLSAASGRDLSQWSNIWLETSGVNTLTGRAELDDAGVITRYSITQSAPDGVPLRPHRIGIAGYRVAEAASGPVPAEQVFYQELDIEGVGCEVEFLKGMAHPGMIVLNAGDLAYAKIRNDANTQQAAIERLSVVDDSLTRVLLYASLWDQVHDGELNPRVFLDTVVKHIGNETHGSLMSTVLNQAASVYNNYVPAHAQQQLRSDYAEALAQLMRQAEAGSAAQLQLFISFVQAATQAQAGTLRALLQGEEQLEGLTLDADLRWKVLISLAAAGQASEAELEQALAADTTANGQLAFDTAMAARPSAEAKEAAWQQVLRAELANSRLRATVAGFQQSHDAELLAAYQQKYFAAVESIWQSRTSHEVTETLITGLFPRTQVNQGTIDQAETLVQRYRDSAPALARMIAECRDDVVRATAAQAAFH